MKAKSSSSTGTVFLGGPIQHAVSHGVFDGRVRGTFETFIAALEEAGFRVHSAHRVERFGEVDVEGLSCEVTERDFRWMLDCDVFVAVLPSVDGELLRTDGTCIELGWASALGKPVVMVRDTERISHLMSGLQRVSEVSVLGYERVRANPSELVDEVARAIFTGGARQPAKTGRPSPAKRQNGRRQSVGLQTVAET